MASEDQPKLVSHCAALYSKLDSEAKAINDDDDSSGRVWRGKIIDACRLIGITSGSYNRVVNSLRTLGCIEQIEQGHRGKPSTYLIHYPPTPEVWRDHAPDTTRDLTRGPSSDTMAAQIKNLETQLGGINIVDALVSVEDQMIALRNELRELREQIKRLPTANGS